VRAPSTTASTPWLLISSWLWHLTRWDGPFLGTYLVTDLGAPPIANQFVGVAMFAPLLLGALVANRTGTPRMFVGVTMSALLPVSVLMAGAVGAGAVTTPMVYPYELALGFGGMVNMTAQRELLFGIGGARNGTRIINTEVTAMASAMMLGPLLGGVSIAVFGLGVAYAIPAVLLAVAIPLFWLSTRGITAAPADLDIAVPSAPHAADRRLLQRSRMLVVVLVVTLICNLCYFAFLPLVPVIARYLHAGPGLAGVIGATAGVVQLAVSALLVVRPVRRPAAAYAGGVAICLCALGLLSYAPGVGVALVVLGVAGIGQALFGTTQATLPVAAVAPGERRAALGLLSTTIGVALPSGMVLLGVMASVFGAQPAMLISAVAGLVALGALVCANPGLFGVTYRRMASGGPTGIGGEGNSITTQPELG